MKYRPITLILLCGGEGSRLKPLSDKYPKPSVPINGVPNIENTVRNFLTYSYAPVDRIILASSQQTFDKLSEDFLFNPNIKLTFEWIDPANRYNNFYTLFSTLSSPRLMYLRLVEASEVHEEDFVVVEGDVVITRDFFRDFNKSLKEVNSRKSRNSLIYCTERNNEWVLSKDKGKTVVSKNSNGLAMSGVSYVTLEDMQNIFLKMDSSDWSKCGDCFWDEFFVSVPGSPVSSVCNPDIYPVKNDSLVEYDTIDDLISKGLMTEDEIRELIESE